MEVVSNNYMPGDPRLVQQLVYELKSQGIFDQFRKECISDVDTKPAYQNLRQRVEGSVTSFLKQQTWRPDMNKNQVREQLRKSIYESGYLETGVERIVDQVVNPKINTVFLPHVEDVVYRYLGIEKPNRLEIKKEIKIDVTDLLPTDLEAVSPESDHAKEDSLNLSDSLNVDSKLEEDESPPFEPLIDIEHNDVQHNDVQHEDNSVDSHLSGFSGLQSHDSNPCNETKICQMELSNQDSQVSHNSSESHLSIVTSEENTKMEVCGEAESKLLKSVDSEEKLEISVEIQTNNDRGLVQIETEEIKKTEKSELEKKDEQIFDEYKFEDRKMIDKKCDDKQVIDKKYDDKQAIDKKYDDKQAIDKKNDDKQITDKKYDDKQVIDKKSDDKKSEEKKTDEKKYHDKKSDDKKSRSSEKHSSRDRKDDKYKKSSSSNSSRDKDKASSRHSSSASSRDKDKNKDRKESKTSSSNNKEKDKEKPEKDRSDKEKSKSEKDRERGDRDKSKSSSSSSNKHSNSKDKDKSHSSSKKDPSGKDKEKSRSSSSSASKESKSKSTHSESKSKSSTDKHKKDEKTSHSGRHSSSSSSLKKDKDKKRDSKKESKDDHYSSKEKKNGRRSTDRDSNDGQSSRQSQSNSFIESSSNTQKNSQESNSNSGSGSGDSGNSDQIEHKKVISPIKLSRAIENKEVASTCTDIQKFKYIKPKFASNFEEARKLMKIRKQLAKLERQNQLSLTQIDVSIEIPTINGMTYPEPNIPEKVNKVILPEQVTKVVECKKPPTPEIVSSPTEVTPMLQSTELSKENWEALEARLAQEMSNINYNSYESPYDYDYDYTAYNSIVISPRKNTVTEDTCTSKEENVDKTPEPSKSCKLDFNQKEEVLSQKSEDVVTESFKSPSQEAVLKTASINNLEKNRKLSIQLETSVYKNSKSVKILKRGENGTKNGDKHKQDIIGAGKFIKNKLSKKKKKIARDHNRRHKIEEKWENVSDIDYECRYLETPSPSVENNLQFIQRHIKKLECEVEHSVKAFQNNFLCLKKVGCKRKLEEHVDLKNNNKAHYEQIETKKRRRSIAPNPNSVISQANKEKMCNSTDISPNDSFSLPLSPAESDKSNDKKEDESPKLTKQKRNVIGRNTSTRSQRYSSDDLYKPRPLMIPSTRRSRGAKNPGN